ncbi:hypothetical protein [Turicibacter sanguinis]|uniref:hypothetical protein n=1 Tax=Turicibacter sanguinis TaxID=154288 RepID=UPI00189F01DE|nr:hypothetical protein [Turicibacter sanguinis]
MKKPKIAKRKNIYEAVTYAYIRKVKKWMFCPACQQGKMTINKKSTLWTCEDCEYTLSADEFEDNYIFWFCDECNTYLNNQEGFDRNASRHICKKCGYENDTTIDNVKGICSDCGKIIPDPDGSLCFDCKFVRRQKAKERLATAIKVAAEVVVVVAAAVAGADEGGFSMKCANCGNTDENTLWDEGDTVYCSRCCHRTSKETGEDDLVECPYCHRMRDRKVMYCRWCNDSTWQSSTQEEFEETDKILKDMGY